MENETENVTYYKIHYYSQFYYYRNHQICVSQVYTWLCPAINVNLTVIFYYYLIVNLVYFITM